MTKRNLSFVLVISLGLLAWGCGDDDNGGTDAGGGVDAGYADGGGDVDAGYADGGGGSDFDFRTDAPDAYTRVDRVGMPAVSTALVSSSMKNAFNDGSPANDVEGEGCDPITMPGSCTWGVEFVTNIQAIHDLSDGTNTTDEQLSSLGLTPCGGGVACATQAVAGPVTVASLVIPDELTIDTTSAAGFPNGRMLGDPALDITLAILLLDLTTHGAGTFTDLNGEAAGTPSLNPLANDVDFGTTFPYVAPPNAP